MSDEQRQEEDVAGLFRRFGGDARSYKEFAPIEGAERAAGSWPLVNGGTRPADAPEPSPVPAPTPAPAPAPVPASLTTPAAALFTSTPAAAPSHDPAPRELDALFARLAGATDPAVGNGPGLLSRWRKPT